MESAVLFVIALSIFAVGVGSCYESANAVGGGGGAGCLAGIICVLVGVVLVCLWWLSIQQWG